MALEGVALLHRLDRAAEAAHRTLTVPLPPVQETVPAGGFLTLAAGVLDLCGARDLDGFGHQVATLLTSFAQTYERAPLTWPRPPSRC